MEPTYLPFIVAATIAMGALVQGVTGFGSALVAMPLLLLLMKPRVAVPLVILNGLLITGFLSMRMRHHLDWSRIGPLFLGSIPGVLAGALFLKEAPAWIIKLLLGVILVGYSLYCLVGRMPRMKLGSGWGYVAGFLTGAIGAAFSAGGPPVIVYTTLTGWSKDAIKATLSGFFFINGVLIAVAHISTGLTTWRVLSFLPFTLPATLAAVALGSLFYGRLHQKSYLNTIYLLLLAMGVMMLYSAWRAGGA